MIFLKWLISLPIIGTIALLFKGNRDFFKIINEFHDKLPPKYKQAKKGELEKLHFSVIDTSSMGINLSTTDIDLFHKRLENFNYSRVLVKRKSIISFSKNIQRILNTTPNEKFKLAVIQDLLEGDTNKDRIPYLLGYKLGKVIGF